MNEASFLWRGMDREGSRRAVRVNAASAQAAREALEQDGWTQLELLLDEIASTAAGGVEAPEWLPTGAPSPDFEAALLDGTEPSFASRWWNFIKAGWGTFFLLTAGLAWGFYQLKSWLIWSSALGLAALGLVFPVLDAWFGSALRIYKELNEAKVWWRWKRVMSCVQRLQRSHRFTRIGVGDEELARCRAQALAGLGRLEEGLREFQAVEHLYAQNHWLYLSLLGGIYDIAKDYERSTECTRRALAEKPDLAALWIDLALRLARGLNQPAEAKEALARAEGLELSGLAKTYLAWVGGIIGWRERRYGEAKLALESALAQFQKMSHLPLVEGSILLTKSYLCAVEGPMGNRSRAEELWREVRPFLECNREEELLEACRQSVRPTSEG